MSDRQQLNTTIARLYDVICFPEGGNPDWSGMAQLFLPGARITRITPEARDDLDFEGFKNMVTELLDEGVITSFYEREIGRRCELFGSVAHVLSAYETKSRRNAIGVLGRGLNSLQLVRVGNDWRIVSLLWDESCPAETAHYGFETWERLYG